MIVEYEYIFASNNLLLVNEYDAYMSKEVSTSTKSKVIKLVYIHSTSTKSKVIKFVYTFEHAY